MIDSLAWHQALAELPDDVTVTAFNGRYSANLPAIKLRAAGRREVYLTPDDNFRVSCIEGAVVVMHWPAVPADPKNNIPVRRPWSEIVEDLAAVARRAAVAP